jgi:uncharacterized RDD family membrane protein YckC
METISPNNHSAMEPEFIETAEQADIGSNDLESVVDYSTEYKLPMLVTRYISMLIDVMTIILLAFGFSRIFEMFENTPDAVRGITFVFVVILYEPILVSTGATLGQLLMNIRVRNIKNPENKISLPAAFLRTIVKWLLGWISFITISFNQNKRALHDMAGGSIMIAGKIQEE